MSKTFLSIGSGPGIGLATARRFAAEGYDIVLSSRNPAALQQHAEALRATGVGVTIKQVDTSNAQQVAALAGAISDGGELVLHYNTAVLVFQPDGILVPQPIETQSTEMLTSTMQINLSSALVAIQSALPGMKRHGKGSILITGGGVALRPRADQLTLSVSKAGLRSMTQALFEPLSADNIHIATVTVNQLIGADSQDSRDIAELFWKLHAQAKTDWTWEEWFGARIAPATN
ncbi:SDR family oxidoreductase [Rugamonas sp.]|uniref:SDR family NAD(P)-dependent oxidoreductase n=1 Tax=Rugamonas sp. TaxID=1926287 RepID=UPI0025F67C0E|nr:SDR family oxidoreductase [Rugamonas sp.]